MRLLIFVSLFFCHLLQASFYDRAMEGRYWYDEKTSEDNSKTAKVVITEDNAVEELQLLRQKVDTAKALAVLAPNTSNVRHYMRLQKHLMTQAEKFSKTWEKILLEDATLSGQLSNPTAQYAVNARKEVQYEEIEATLEKHRDKHLLLFVYDSREKFSQIAGQMMTAFIEDTKWEAIGVSIDQGNLPEFPKSKIVADQGKTLGITATPSYVIVNKETEEVIQAGFGAISVSQLKENISAQLKEVL